MDKSIGGSSALYFLREFGINYHKRRITENSGENSQYFRKN